jgi:ABC-type oligopeptide transport system substrate-binding subunit
MSKMRKLIALTMVALLAMTVALAAAGCGRKTEETTTTETPPVESTMPDTMGMTDTMMSDTMPH